MAEAKQMSGRLVRWALEELGMELMDEAMALEAEQTIPPVG